jgi:hypothetical protein
MRRAQEQLPRVIESLPKLRDPEALRKATEPLQRGQAAKIQQAVTDATRALPHQDLKRLSDLVAETWSLPQMRAQLERVAAAQRLRYASAAELADAAGELEQQIEEAGDLPEDERRASLAWWLATRPPLVQAALLHAGLGVLTPFAALVAEAAGEDIPAGVTLGVELCLAMVAFLLLWLSERNKSE